MQNGLPSCCPEEFPFRWRLGGFLWIANFCWPFRAFVAGSSKRVQSHSSAFCCPFCVLFAAAALHSDKPLRLVAGVSANVVTVAAASVSFLVGEMVEGLAESCEESLPGKANTLHLALNNSQYFVFANVSALFAFAFVALRMMNWCCYDWAATTSVRPPCAGLARSEALHLNRSVAFGSRLVRFFVLPQFCC